MLALMSGMMSATRRGAGSGIARRAAIITLFALEAAKEPFQQTFLLAAGIAARIAGLDLAVRSRSWLAAGWGRNTARVAAILFAEAAEETTLGTRVAAAGGVGGSAGGRAGRRAAIIALVPAATRQESFQEALLFTTDVAGTVGDIAGRPMTTAGTGRRGRRMMGRRVRRGLLRVSACQPGRRYQQESSIHEVFLPMGKTSAQGRGSSGKVFPPQEVPLPAP